MGDRAFPGGMSIFDARREVELRADEGCRCPVCEQNVKAYRRKLNSVPARAVMGLYAENGREWGSMADIARRRLPRFANQGGYLVLGKHWGLIEPEIRDGGSRTGRWRVTQLGEEWLLERRSVQEIAVIFNDRVIARDGAPITARQTLGVHFDLNELLNRRGTPGEPLQLFQEAA